MEQVNFTKVVNDPDDPRAAGAAEDAIQPAHKRSLFRMLARAEEKERRRIARELHDTTSQDLVAVGLNLRRIEKVCQPAPLSAETHQLFEQTSQLLRQVQQDLRTMSYVLHPPPVDEAGLAVALQTLATGLSKRGRFRVALESNLSGRIPVAIEEALYRVAQEALINCCRHAHPSKGAIRCNLVGDTVVLEVEDDGVGFDGAGEAPMLGVGLRAIRARVRAVGGEMEVVRLDQGTLVRARVPLTAVGIELD